MIQGVVILTVATAITAALLTGAVRSYALRRGLVDIPNDRSSHVSPTVRGGGLAIVLSLSLAVGVAWIKGWIAAEFGAALVGGGLIVATVGWLDDHRPLSPISRLIVHFAAAGWAVYWLGGFPALRLATTVIQLGPLGTVLSLVGIVWLINLYNFMDGIDGLASAEAVTVCLGAAVLAALASAGHTAVGSLLIAAASAGFLVWNWQPARIFMGDVGSSYLGFCIAVTAVASERSGGPSLLLWAVLLGVFVVDATTTLTRRALHGKKLAAAHRTHAYQRAVQSGWSHAHVTLTIMCLNVVLFALAYIGLSKGHLQGVVLIAAAALLAAAYCIIERQRPMFKD